LLDLDHGSYPYVTSSNTVAGSLCGGLGISPKRVDAVLGVLKAYCTRVGGGPMPTELDDGPEGLGQKLRDRGQEYGTTTGRPRRCGWFDGVAAAYANRLSRFDTVCITLLDVLDAFEEIRVCTAYRLNGGERRSMPASAAEAERVEPVWETLPGWMSDTTGIRRWEDLPERARAYLDRLGELIGAEIGMVGVGPDRTQSIVRPGSWLTHNVEPR
jgi:adenylosuccinate synthase